MKILTWNINGVRAVQRDRTNLKKILDSLEADIVCLQETKVTRDMLDEPTAIVDDFESYFSFSRKKSGYSGTANYCKTDAIPVKAEEGLTGKLTTPHESRVYQYGNTDGFSDEDLLALDEEGRCVITQHRVCLPTGVEKEVAIINVYVPRAGDREDRHEYKLKFLTLLQNRAEALLSHGINVIILGDINTSHRQIDNCDPDEEFFRKSSRIWLNRLLQQKERDNSIPESDANLAEVTPASCKLEGGNFSDAYRQLHPLQECAFTNWCNLTGARQTNFGRRLDYILIDTELSKLATHCEIMSDVEGSDHCPVILTLDVKSIPAPQSPLLCSKFMPEFKGQQKKLSSFFTKVIKTDQSPQKDKAKELSKKDEQFDFAKEEQIKTKSDQLLAMYQSSNITESSETNSGLKRKLASGAVKLLSPTSNKKSKLNKKVSVSDTQQISLTSFFSQKNSNSNKGQYSSTRHGPTNKKIDSNITTVKTDQAPIVDCLVIDDNDSDVEETIPGHRHLFHPQSSESHDELSHDSITTTRNDFEMNTRDSDPIYSLTSCKKDVDEVSKPTYLNKERSPDKKTSSSQSSQSTSKSQASAWKGLLGGLPPPPLCPGHKEPSVLRTVKKAGPNFNKQFYVCARPDGASSNPQSRCDFFQWLTKKR